ncbi:MAG: hypothetical protein LBC07_03945, partial [Elusimicrobiota bacterium]|nr:hypothetical protein [Elusimicrobiota bacterium]
YSKQVDPIALREAIKSALETRPFSSKGKGLKIKEWAQVSVKPPFFVFEVNDKELVHFSDERYLANCLREAFGFYGTPIFLKFRQYFRNSKS